MPAFFCEESGSKIGANGSVRGFENTPWSTRPRYASAVIPCHALVRRVHVLLAALWLCVGCASPSAVPSSGIKVIEKEPASASRFLQGLTRPWPPSDPRLLLTVSSAESQRVSSYDNALMALYFMRRGQREQAGRVLAALAKLQQPDGALPFSFNWPAPDPKAIYVRTGAVAWVGYAASEYLDADAGGFARAEITEMAHRIANFLLAHQRPAGGDARADLVLGGSGSYRLELVGSDIHETFVPGDVVWASTEHNIDAFFFLRDFGALTGDARFSNAATRIRNALQERAWMPAAGQFARGFNDGGVDHAYALDCASWGALFLLAAGEELRAETAWAAAESRFLSRAATRGAFGHRPYAHAPIIENAALAGRVLPNLTHNNWDALDGVWAEGSAGVALAALRLGRRFRSQEILDRLEPLRALSGGLPTFTSVVPFELDADPSVAGTAWSELVRYELSREDGRESLWRR